MASPYADVALSVYVKVAALAARPEGCEAKAETVAAYLGLSKASVERGLAALSRPGPDGVVELVTTRRTYPGGRGASAVRRTRPVPRGERFVWVPVAAAEDLTPRQLRAYAVVAYAERRRIPLTEGELAGYLRHHSGDRAGRPVTADAAGRVVDALEAAGWVTVGRRCGAQGRHRFIAHDIAHPIPPAASDADAEAIGGSAAGGGRGTAGEHDQEATDASMVSAGPGVGEGSGSVVGEGSLAYRESPRTDSPEDVPDLFSPAVGALQLVGPRRRPVPKARHGSNGEHGALRADENPDPRLVTSANSGRSAASTRTSASDVPGFSAEVYAVLEPVRWVLARVSSGFVVRKIARAVEEQLQAGMEPARLRHRLTLRFGSVSPSEIRDPGRWLLGVALPRWGCGHWDCEAGVMWSTGRRCAACTDIVSDRRAELRHAEQAPGCAESDRSDAPTVHDSLGGPPQQPAGPRRGDCADCGGRIFLVGPAMADGLCRACREERDDTAKAPKVATPPPRDAGWAQYLAELARRPLPEELVS
ncbi:MAG TPA: hypothetical protein VLH10_14930 [Yinghuangia sp.]|nr:hypothetical protein [Yinghuangia sp.]